MGDLNLMTDDEHREYLETLLREVEINPDLIRPLRGSIQAILNDMQKCGRQEMYNEYIAKLKAIGIHIGPAN